MVGSFGGGRGGGIEGERHTARETCWSREMAGSDGVVLIVLGCVSGFCFLGQLRMVLRARKRRDVSEVGKVDGMLYYCTITLEQGTVPLLLALGSHKALGGVRSAWRGGGPCLFDISCIPYTWTIVGSLAVAYM